MFRALALDLFPQAAGCGALYTIHGPITDEITALTANARGACGDVVRLPGGGRSREHEHDPSPACGGQVPSRRLGQGEHRGQPPLDGGPPGRRVGVREVCGRPRLGSTDHEQVGHRPVRVGGGRRHPSASRFQHLCRGPADLGGQGDEYGVVRDRLRQITVPALGDTTAR